MKEAEEQPSAIWWEAPARQWTLLLQEREEQVFLVLTLLIGAFVGGGVRYIRALHDAGVSDSRLGRSIRRTRLLAVWVKESCPGGMANATVRKPRGYWKRWAVAVAQPW